MINIYFKKNSFMLSYHHTSHPNFTIFCRYYCTYSLHFNLGLWILNILPIEFFTPSNKQKSDLTIGDGDLWWLKTIVPTIDHMSISDWLPPIISYPITIDIWNLDRWIDLFRRNKISVHRFSFQRLYANLAANL